METKKKEEYSFIRPAEKEEPEKGMTMKEYPPDERPYEKCFKMGANILSDSELIAVILKCGAEGSTSLEVAREILKMPDGTLSLLALHSKSLASLMKVRGIGQVKAVTLKCVAELAARIARESFRNSVFFSNASEVAGYYSEQMRHLTFEETRLVCLNSASRFLGDCVLSTGLVNQTLLSAREVFLKALEYQAVYIILLHNHPGGDPRPSRQDIIMTKQLCEAGSLMNIKLLDHIIIGDSSYVSLKDSGYINAEV